MKTIPIPKLDEKDLKKNRIIIIEKYMIDESDFTSLFHQLQFFSKNDVSEPVFIVFKSNGGDPYSGYKMYRTIHAFRKKFDMKIMGIAWGNVDSIATLIFQACTLRYMIYPHSSLFFHLLESAARKLNAEIDIEKHFETEKNEYKALKIAQQRFYRLFADASQKLTMENVKDLFVNNLKASPARAIKLGFADFKINEETFDFNNPKAILK